jgi:NAD(P)-dependent dehydrogenase (short-subunit alcohol dehydrogenase family)
MRLKDKVAVVTGGGSGIGAATARLFAREGAKVVVTGRRPTPIEAVAAEVAGVAVSGDTLDPVHAAQVIEAAVASFGGVDVLVTCAGESSDAAVGEVSDEIWRRTLDTNLTGPMVLARAALPAMVMRGGGSVVLVSSVNGLVAAPASAAFDVSKAALLALARAIAVDYGVHGVRANTLCPGWVATAAADEAIDELASTRGVSRQAAYDLVTRDVPLRRPATPEEIAACCLFLASEESSIVTGSVLVADGGGLAVDVTGTAFTVAYPDH